jgi:uroporphyrinogen-III synthase
MRGWRILVTRPDAGSLTSRLRDRGARPVVVPTIEIAELAPGGGLDAAVRKLGGFDWIVVTSANGARALFRRLRALSITPPEGPRWAAVGPATAAALAAEGVRAERVPRAGTAAAVARILGDLAGARVLLPRARIAGWDLPSALTARGALVVDVPAYDTVIGPESSRVPLAQALEGGLEAAIFTSGSTVQGFFRLAADPRRALSTILTVCIGRSTARALADMGVEASAVAAAPSPTAIVEAIERVAHARA